LERYAAKPVSYGQIRFSAADGAGQLVLDRPAWTKALGVIALAVVIAFLTAVCVHAQTGIPTPRIDIGIASSKSPQEVSNSLQIVLILTILSIAPALLVMLTSFTRIVIVLSFTRNAIGSPQIPPNSVLMGLALFLTFFTMAPVWQQVNTNALQPYLKHEITMEQATATASVPLKDFMLRQTRPKDIALFVNLSNSPRPQSKADLEMTTLIPAFLISELKTAFTIGFVVFIPFLIVDMVVAVILMSMGMMMLPPIMISLPFKILLFVLVDGWNLLIGSLAHSFK